MFYRMKVYEGLELPETDIKYWQIADLFCSNSINNETCPEYLDCHECLFFSKEKFKKWFEEVWIKENKNV